MTVENKPMTIDRLNQYRHLCREVDALEDEVRDLREKAHSAISDTVTASMLEFPFNKHMVIIEGQGATGHARLRKRINRLVRQREKLAIEADAVETFVEHIPDSQTRQIMRLHFMRGMTWQETANRCGGGNTADGVRKKVERYME